MTLPLPARLRDTALRIQREESIHLGNLIRLLREAADAIEDGGAKAAAPVGPMPRPLDATGVALTPGGRGKLEIRERQTIVRRKT